MNLSGPRVVFEIPILGGIRVTETVITGWCIILALLFLCLWLTHDLQKRPSKKQVFAEYLVTTINNLVKSTMGENNLKLAPYIAAVFTFSITGTLVGLLALRSMTADINVTMTWAFMTFMIITYYKFKTNGFFGYFKSYTQPVPLMTPLNIISEFALPVSLGFRHFGNIVGGMAITGLLYMGLSAITNAIGISFPFFAVGIPAVLSVYFDLFSGFMQAFIFSMLTMANVGSAQE